MFSSPAPEFYYQQALADSLDGRVEVQTPAGTIDVLTADELIEVKFAPQWKSALGQALAYGHYFPGHQKRLHLIGVRDLLVEQVCLSLGVRVTWEEAVMLTQSVPRQKNSDLLSLAFKDSKDIDADIAAVNKRLKLGGVKVSIERRGGRLWLRGTLPPKPHSGKDKPYRQKLPLGVSASLVGLKLAEDKARQVSYELRSNSFDWGTYVS